MLGLYKVCCLSVSYGLTRDAEEGNAGGMTARLAKSTRYRRSKNQIHSCRVEGSYRETYAGKLCDIYSNVFYSFLYHSISQKPDIPPIPHPSLHIHRAQFLRLLQAPRHLHSLIRTNSQLADLHHPILEKVNDLQRRIILHVCRLRVSGDVPELGQPVTVRHNGDLEEFRGRGGKNGPGHWVRMNQVQDGFGTAEDVDQG